MLTIDQLLKTAKSKLKIYRNMRLVADRQIAESLTIFIPDMHLLEKGATDDFFHGKQENEDRFLGLLDFLLALKKKEGEKLQIVQLGDLMDVWQAKWNANGIVAAYPSIIGLIEKIRSVYVVGNHDIDLWRWYQEQGETFGRVWRHHIAVAGKIRAVVEHGFQADFFNNQAQWSGVMGKEVAKIVGMMEYLYPDIDEQLGAIWDAIVRIFGKYNVFTPVKDPGGFNTHEYLRYYLDLIKKYNAGETDDHYGPDQVDIILAVIGHTHVPRLVQAPGGDRTYYLMDCGSWVDDHNELGVIAGREMALCTWG
jgi:UDP-2,3-diacylglucosamine pyrophosphatase LpxH